MTKAEWLACTNPAAMLEHLQGKASDRKLRLFAAACCRRIWRLLADERSRRAVECVERAADGLVAEEELAAARRLANAASDAAAKRVSEADGLYGIDPSPENGRELDVAETARTAADAVCNLVEGPERARHVAFTAACAAGCEAELALPNLGELDQRQAQTLHDAAARAESSAQSDLVRDIFNNPFRSLPPRKGKKKGQEQWRSWLAWDGGTIRKLGQAIYDERAFERLPVLADALEEAGCTDPELLHHCRQPGEHVRGCWVVDLLLGKS